MRRVAVQAVVGAVVLGAGLALAGCSGRSPTASGEELLSPELVAAVLDNRPRGDDPGLYLYRIPLTRNLVVRFYTEVTGSETITGSILSAAENNGVSLPLAFALAWGESSFRVRAVNRNRNSSLDRGLFQLNSRTFPALKEEQYFDPATNARYGLAHFRYCLEKGGSEVVALAMYNAGTRRVLRGTPYSTLKHVAKILDYRERLSASFHEMIQDPLRVARVSTGPARF